MHNKLFSYGTLQYPKVQLDTFGRYLETQSSQVTGYVLSKVEITDPAVLASSGESFHPIISHTGNMQDKVEGAIMLLTDEELAQADSYEVDDYARMLAETTDGQQVWVYIESTSGKEQQHG